MVLFIKKKKLFTVVITRRLVWMALPPMFHPLSAVLLG